MAASICWPTTSSESEMHPQTNFWTAKYRAEQSWIIKNLLWHIELLTSIWYTGFLTAGTKKKTVPLPKRAGSEELSVHSLSMQKQTIHCDTPDCQSTNSSTVITCSNFSDHGKTKKTCMTPTNHRQIISWLLCYLERTTTRNSSISWKQCSDK